MPRVLRPPEAIAAVAALVLGLVHQLVVPNSGTDLALQLDRASFARAAPFTPVDLSFFSGVHPFSYSLLTPWIMAVLGVGLAGLLTAVAAAVLFARLLRDLRFPYMSAVLGAVFAVANVVSGRTTFALAAVALLAALLLRERRVLAVVFAVLTALMSPVGAAFLGLCAAVLVLHRRPGGWTLGISAMVPVIVLVVMFPGGGVQPFSTASAIPAIIAAIVVACLTLVPMVRTGALLYGAAVIVFVVSPGDPFGSNILRLALLVAAAVLIATHRPPTWLAAIAVVALLIWQTTPLRTDLAAASAPSLRVVTAELESLGARRVEVVAGREHRESFTVAERIPLARGWLRQIDYRDNRLFYEGDLTASRYLAWLRDHAVDHVAVPRRGAIDFGGTREAALLRHPVAGLDRVWSDDDWSVYAVAQPRPIAGAPAVVLSSMRTALTLSSPSSGDAHVVITWSRWLTVSGPACIAEDHGQVRVHFRSPGTVVIGSGLWPKGHC